jgi:hypothetical protein
MPWPPPMHKVAPQSVAAHRVDEAGRQNRASGTDRMPMGNGAAVDVDNVR